MTLGNKAKILILGDINSIHLLRWLEGLKNEFEIRVCSLDPFVSDHSSDRIEGIKVASFPQKVSGRGNKLGYLAALKFIRKEYNDFRPDIVHAHYATSYGLLARLLRSDKLYISVWGSDVFEFPKKSPFQKSLFKWILRKADIVFSTSEVMARETRKYYSGQIITIPFGIDPDQFIDSENHQNNGTFILGTVKTLEQVYGIDILIRAFKIVHDNFPESECHIYGRGSQLNTLKDLVHNLDLESSVVFHGFIEHKLVAKVLSEMDVFCVLSRRESFGVAAVEASAAGLPVIASRVGGLPEVIIDNATGFLVESENYKQAADKIIKLIQSPDLRKEMGQKGREFVRTNYDWQKNLEQMKKFYRK